MDVDRRNLMKGMVAGGALLAFGAPRWGLADSPGCGPGRCALLLGHADVDDAFETGARAACARAGYEGLEVVKRKGGLLSDPGQMVELLERSRGTRWIAVLDDASAAVFQELVRSAASGLLSRGSHACSEDGSVPLRHVWMVASPVWSAGALLAASLIEGGTSFSITETFLHEPSAPRAAEIPIPAPFGGRDEVGRDWVESVGRAVAASALGLGAGRASPADRAFVHRTSHRERRLATQRFASFVVDL